MAGSQLPLRSFLDPRDSPEPPWEDAVWIPLSELGSRSAELPPPGETVRVLGDEELFLRTRARLIEIGRSAEAAGPGMPSSDYSRGRLWRPNDWLAEQTSDLAPGRAADLGCGGGREAVFLAAAGWSVVAVDRLEDALHRGERFANGALGRDFAARIEWRQMDLLRSVAQGPFDLIYALFWFDREALRAHARELVPGGRLVVEAFTDAHFAATGRPTSPDRRIRIGELQGLMPDLEFVAGNEAFRSGRHTARAVWRSRP